MDVKLSEQVGNAENVRENFKKIRKAFKNIPTSSSVIWGDIDGEINNQSDLISGGKILPSLLPAIAITDTYVVSSEAEMLALGVVTVDNPIPAETGDVCIRMDQTKTYILKGADPSVLADWELLLTPTGGVISIFGRSGAVTAQSGDYSFSLISGTAGATQGGTGLTSYAAGDLIYASAANVLSRLAKGTDGQVLTLAGGLPVWATPSGGGGLPSQIGNAGKYLTTDGTNPSWAGTPLWTAAGSDIYYSTGNVGINNTSPTTLLSVKTPATNATIVTAARFYNPGASNGVGAAIFLGYADNDTSGVRLEGYFGSVAQEFRIKVAGTQQYLIRNSDQTFGTSSTGTYNFFNGITLKNGTAAWRIIAGTNFMTLSGNGGTDYFWKGGWNIGVSNEFKSPTAAATDVIVRVVASASQTADIQQWTDSSNTVLASISTKGFLPPRMTLTQWIAIASKAEGLQGWNNTDHAQMWFDGTRNIGFRYNGTKFQGYDGTSWIDLN